MLLTGLADDSENSASLSVPISDVYVSLRVNWPGYGQKQGAVEENQLEITAIDGLVRENENKSFARLSAAQKAGLSQILEDVGVPEPAAADQQVLSAAWSRLCQTVKEKPEAESIAVESLLQTAEIDQVFRFSRHLLIEGDPGSGKTTQLKHVVMALAEAIQGNVRGAREMGFEAPFPLPFFVELKELAAWLNKKQKRFKKEHAGQLVEYLEDSLDEVSGGRKWIKSTLEKGAAAVMLDGLDEIADSGLRERVSFIVNDFLIVYNRCRFGLTSRPAGLTPAVLHALNDLAHCVVQPLEPRQIEAFIRLWYRELIPNPVQAEEKVLDLLGNIESERKNNSRGWAELASTPITLTVITMVHRSIGRLPHLRAELYERCVTVLCDRWDHTRGVSVEPLGQPLSLSEKRALFQELAYATQVNGKSAPPLERADSYRLVRHVCQRTDQRMSNEQCRELLIHMGNRSGLIIPAGKRAYKFRHRIFQEYLTARRICHQAADPGRELGTYLNNPWWREVIALAPAYTALNSSAATCQLLTKLIDAVRKIEEDDPQWIESLALLSRVLVDLREYQVTGLSDIAEMIKADWVLIVENESQPGDVLARKSIANALGWFGDPRLAPERQWVDIPAGKFKRKTKWIHVDAFQIQRWPVTVGEYARFIKAEGYRKKSLWSQRGREWRDKNGILSPANWNGQRNHAPNHPVVGVSWYEAEAYCRWLSQIEKDTICLPNGNEWEKAAKGGRELSNGQKNPIPSRGFPWGSDFETGWGNTAELALGGVTPVGLFAKGHGPLGIWDQMGNCWEWVSDVHQRNGEELRERRGGSWYNKAEYCRSTMRLNRPPGYRGGFLGFRPAKR